MRELHGDAESKPFSVIQAKYICSAEIMANTGLPWSEITRLEAAGKFPKRVHPSGFWSRADVESWAALGGKK